MFKIPLLFIAMLAILALILLVHTKALAIWETASVPRRESRFRCHLTLAVYTSIACHFYTTLLQLPNSLLQSAVGYTYLTSKMSAPISANPALSVMSEMTRWSSWGDDRGFQVFAEACCRGLHIIFRFSTDPTFRRSIQSRIVTCYHGNPAADTTETFVDMDTMREEVWWSIANVWDSCSRHPSVKTPDVVVEIYEDEHDRLQWRLSHLSVYVDYLEQLLPLAKALYEELPLEAYETFLTVDISNLIYYGAFAGRGDSKLVRLQTHSELLVFKGLDLAEYLISGTDFQYWRDNCYREIRTIRSLSPHPNIIFPATMFVTAAAISEEPHQGLVCGTLYPYMTNGNLNDQVKKAMNANSRLVLAEKAKWCYQMVSAIAHTHRSSQTYHQDIKPSNFLMDDNRDLVLIGWEQNGASRCTIAPEADGSYDLQIQPDSPNTKLLYKRYEGPERVNHPYSWPHWNVFPIWRDISLDAVEAAEVFSLGRTMWMLLEETDEGNGDEVIAPYWEKAHDVPQICKAIVNRCLESDPNMRVELSELETFMSFWNLHPYLDPPNL